MKKEGIMRINSYNKFFAKVAEIMNTAVKAVKQLDGRYKVELANHVYLNVYRGVSGSLFIHDHRGITHITSCYDFEDFKTMKDLYERLVSDYSESVKKVMEVKQELNTCFGKKEQQYFDTDCLELNKTIIAKIENINCCPNQNSCCIRSPFIHCNYNYKSDSCIKAHKNFIHYCESVHKQMKAISNPHWHTVRLATVNSSDFIRLNEKLKLYISLYREWKETLKNLRNCRSRHSYERCYSNFRRTYIAALYERKISRSLVMYFDKKVSMANVECGHPLLRLQCLSANHVNITAQQ